MKSPQGIPYNKFPHTLFLLSLQYWTIRQSYSPSDMDNGQLSLLNWTDHGQGKNMEGLRHSLFCATLELENTRQAVKEELKKRDEQLTNLKELLDKTVWERNEAENNCRRMLLEKFLMQQQAALAPISGISTIEDEPRRGIDSNSTFSSSDCEESIVSSPGIDTVQPQQPPAPICATESTLELVPTKPLPEKGKLLQAVLKAGPLLQTLLLAGPLPQWRHPPPPLTSTDIPPARIPSSPRPLTPPPAFFLQDTIISTSSATSNTIEDYAAPTRKRALCDTSTYTIEGKYQRVVLH